MKTLYGVAAALVLASCGIETVSVLPSPNVDYNDQDASYESMEFTHDADLYDGTDFLGYKVYYKIYPYVVGIEGSTRLATDSTTLNSGPLSTLTGMGYKALTRSTGQDPANAVTSILEITGLSDGDVVSLDFSDFLDASNVAATNVQPELRVNGTRRVYVYRTVDIITSDDELQKFSALRTDDTRRVDTSALSSDKTYEVEFFLVASGLADNLEDVESTPKAWGTIQYIEKP
jgi:hypothetical protein